MNFNIKSKNRKYCQLRINFKMFIIYFTSISFISNNEITLIVLKNTKILKKIVLQILI